HDNSQLGELLPDRRNVRDAVHQTAELFTLLNIGDASRPFHPKDSSPARATCEGICLPKSPCGNGNHSGMAAPFSIHSRIFAANSAWLSGGFERPSAGFQPVSTSESSAT